ncbi:MAG: hypothetical protein ACRD07_20825 [Acidimicrobiales bacterium]
MAAIATAALAGPAQAQQTEGLIPEGHWTDEQVTEMLALIDATEQALPAKFPVEATYEELEAALGPMGYFEFGVPAPGGYDHWINGGWLVDEHLVNPEFPESLVYQIGDDGLWHLVSAMFMLSPDIDHDEIPGDIAWLPGWHGHPELCTWPDGTFAGLTDPENPSCPPGSSQASTPLMMHVWIVDNACNHRFGGIGVGGLHCDVDHHDDGMDDGHDDGMDDGHDDGMDDGADRPAPPARPAQPVVATPTFTG